MRFASIRDLHNKTRDVLALTEQEDVVITVRGKPKAVIRKLNEEELEDYVLAHHPKFKRMLQEAWEDYQRHGGVDLDTLIERSRRELAKVQGSARSSRRKRSGRA